MTDAQTPEPEICICAAIQLEDGRVIHGHRHDDCIRTALKWRAAGQDIGDAGLNCQGFVTSRNRFVDRTEGARLTREACRYSAHTGLMFQHDILFSDDLY